MASDFDFDFDLPLNQYFLSEVAEHLESKGINCLDDLIGMQENIRIERGEV